MRPMRSINNSYHIYLCGDITLLCISGEVCSTFTERTFHDGGIQRSIAIFDDIIAVTQNDVAEIKRVCFYRFTDVVDPDMYQWMP